RRGAQARVLLHGLPAPGRMRLVATSRSGPGAGIEALDGKTAREVPRKPLIRNSKMVGVAGFEPTTTCPPDKCATRLRYTPDWLRIIPAWRPSGAGPGASAAQQLEDLLQFHPHLLDDLAAQRRFLLRALAFQALAGAADGVALLVQQAADLAHHEHVMALVVAAVAAALDRAQAREFGLPVAQHVRLDVAQLADLADGEVALGGDRREFAVAARVKHGRLPRRLPPAP